MIEDVDYKLIKGNRWIPVGRLYELIIPMTHYNGDIIPTGFTWDGGTGVPMRYNSLSAKAFFDHDYAFGAPNITVREANSHCIKQLYKDAGIIMAVIIAIMFTLLTPAIYGYFIEEEAHRYKKVINKLANIIALLNIAFLIFVGIKIIF